MAPKRTRRDDDFTDHDLAPSDDVRFVNNATKDRWMIIIQHRPVFSEASFNYSEGEARAVEQNIEERGWGFILEAPVSVNHTLVREFYANFYRVSLQEVYLRGRMIPVSISAIADALHLQGERIPEEEDEYLQRLKNVTEDLLEDIRVTLTDPPAEWTRNHGGEPLRISSRNLTLVARLWMEVVNTYFAPVSHKSDITLRRAILLYTLMRGDRMDIARHIQMLMHMNFNINSKTVLPYGSLITRMAAAAEVPIFDGDLVLPNRAIINLAKIQKAIKPHPPEAGDASAADPEAGTSMPTDPPLHQDTSPSLAGIMSQLGAMHLKERDNAARLTAVEQTQALILQTINENNEAMKRYLHDSLQAMEQNLSRQISARMGTDALDYDYGPDE